MKFLFDLLPLILFFITFKFFGIFAATAVAIGTSAIQISAYLILKKKIDPMMWISLAVIVLFGGATIILHNPTFIIWKPTVLYWTFGLIILGGQWILKKNVIGSIMKLPVEMPEKIWVRLNMAWGFFFVAVGALNLFVAHSLNLFGVDIAKATDIVNALDSSLKSDVTKTLAYTQSMEIVKSMGTWVKFKLFGIMGLLIVFAIAQSAFLSKYIKEGPEKQ